MKVTENTLIAARTLAQDNYETWGSRIIEGYNDKELTDKLRCHDSLIHWAMRASALHQEREDEFERDRPWEDDGGIEVDRQAYRRMID